MGSGTRHGLRPLFIPCPAGANAQRPDDAIVFPLAGTQRFFGAQPAYELRQHPPQVRTIRADGRAGGAHRTRRMTGKQTMLRHVRSISVFLAEYEQRNAVWQVVRRLIEVGPWQTANPCRTDTDYTSPILMTLPHDVAP
ncbi:uncharacterized protein UV8b_03828 [Ustilaginoidea virens]|uniref:Uncharacterized protein n=1 Tax=Ustilaginoidea virens TaxID=1159556 RepID=A0A8E5HQF4_USTVR|nr:uncharacterized protein UV8b_03828 [Ustilaginoidea virens]QUC19587.1 hypothetical protein UV8b_03828 [Ustilaginoidea virens]